MAAKKRDHSEPKPIRFFRVILEDTIESGNLRVPKHFCRNHEKDLCNLNVVFLKVPKTKDLWKVSLRKFKNGEFWFEKGWKEFASFYSIQFGDFVVFKWKLEKSEFKVVIFNKNMSERQYPRMCVPVIKVESSDDEEDDVPVKKMKRSSGEASSSKHGKAQTEHGEYKSEYRAPQQGSDFVSKHPFFQKVITLGAVNHGILGIPISFVRSNINWNCKKQKLTFVTDKGSWPAKLNCDQESGKSTMHGGLLAFLKENFIREEGNLCTFELIDRKKMVFRVYIHRGKNGIPHYADSKRPCSGKMAAADLHGKLDFSTVRLPRKSGSEFASEYPFFQANISKSILFYKTLNVPRTFVKDNMNIEWSHQIVTLETGGGKSWQVKLAIYREQNYRGKLCGGFQAFLGDNDVKEGDFCTFELVEKKKMVFRVTIYRC